MQIATVLSQLTSSQNALVPVQKSGIKFYDQTHIETIDVKCDQKNGMLVTIEFEDEFSGVIYSQGYFSDPKCR